MSNVLNWPWAGGVYIQDDSLEDCTSAGRPRYRQLGGNGFIWNYQGSHWEGTTVLCTLSDSTKQFLVGSSASTPDLVTAGSWAVITTARNAWEPAPGMTVQLTQCRKYIVASSVFDWSYLISAFNACLSCTGQDFWTKFYGNPFAARWILFMCAIRLSIFPQHVVYVRSHHQNWSPHYIQNSMTCWGSGDSIDILYVIYWV